MSFIQLVVVEGVLMLSAGMIFFGGAWGIIGATATLSVINFLYNNAEHFWQWEIPLMIGSIVGIALLLLIGKIANKSQVMGGLVGGFISLILFGAFVTPVVAIILLVLVIGTGLIPKSKKSQVIWSLAPIILRLMLGICLIIYGNILTI